MPRMKFPAFLLTVTPVSFTSAGRSALAVWTAFWTSFVAASRSRSRLNVHVIVLDPSLLDCEVM